MLVEIKELRREEGVVVQVGAAIERVDDGGTPRPGDLGDALLVRVRGRVRGKGRLGAVILVTRSW